MGGGRKKLIPKEAKDEDGSSGERSDQMDLIEEWLLQKKKMGIPAQYVSNKNELLSIRNSTDALLGEFAK